MGNNFGAYFTTMTSPADIIKYAIDGRLANINTCLPARVISYDFQKCKAVLQPTLNFSSMNGSEKPMPVLNNVPVIFPRTNNFSLTYPLEEGDYCLVLFSQRSIDLWLSTGGIVTPDDRRTFDLSDAIAIPGLFPFNIDSQAENNSEFAISFNGGKISIDANGAIQIKTNSTVAIGTQTTELLQVLSTLMTYLQGTSVTGASLGGPLNPVFTAQVSLLQSSLDAIKGTIL